MDMPIKSSSSEISQAPENFATNFTASSSIIAGSHKSVIILSLLIIALTAAIAIYTVNSFKNRSLTDDNLKQKDSTLLNPTPNQAIGTKQLIEESLEKRSKEILDRILGQGRSLVTVNADIDTEVIKRIRKDEESPALAPESDNKTGQFQNMVTEYVQSPGEIKRLSVSVIIDGSYSADKSGRKVFVPVSDNELKNIENILRQALGFDETRDDTIAVTCMPFAATSVERNSILSKNELGKYINPYNP